VHLLVQGAQVDAGLPRQPHVATSWLTDGRVGAMGALYAKPGRTPLLAPGGGESGAAFDAASGASLRALDYLSLGRALPRPAPGPRCLLDGPALSWGTDARHSRPILAS
jgi:hypothetical protein